MATATPSTTQAEGRRRTSYAEATWTGWVGFAGITLSIVAAITMLEGLIAIIRKEYFVVVGKQVIVFDLTTWGWIMLFWGALIAFCAVAIAAGRSWARWLTLVLVGINVVGQLGFLGSTQYPLWTLVVIGLETVIIYALTVRWADAE